VNHHITHNTDNADSLQDVASTNDRSLIRKVVTRARKLSSRDFEVAILVSCEKDMGRESARTLARQKGRKSLKSRRLSQLVHHAAETD
jgi:restriction endonuclease Mrr